MLSPHTGAIRGREAELTEIDALLEQTRAGSSRSLVIRGEPGIGKSALLEEVARRASGMRVMRCTGVESEAGLAFAGLHLLLHPHRGVLDRLPAPQAAALRGALGLDGAPGVGDPPAQDGFLVGAGVHILLAELAADDPVLCLLDDAHWIDEASLRALLFAARRLGAEPVSLVFAVRDEGRGRLTRGLPELLPGRLDAAAAAEVLADQGYDLPAPDRDRVVREAEGNPLALTELAASAARHGRPGPPPVDGGVPASLRVRQSFHRRVRELPDGARLLLTVAAADDTGEPAVVLRAAGGLGASLADLDVLEDRRLLYCRAGRLSFRHPLIRTAAYAAASTARRLAVHRALADVHDPEAEPGRRAWHLAAGTLGPDEDVAAELERIAGQARHRGGISEAATAYERAARLTPGCGRRARRLVAAARAAVDAGRFTWAGELAAAAGGLPHDPVTRGGLAQVRARLAVEQSNLPAAHRLLLEAADAAGEGERDPLRAAFLLLQSMTVALSAGSVSMARATGGRAAALAGTAPRTAPPAAALAAGGVLGLTRVFEGRFAEGLPALCALHERTQERGGELSLRQRADVLHFGLLAGRLQPTRELALALLADCRAQGAVGLLPQTLMWLARAEMLLGCHDDALINATEGLRIAEDTGQRQFAGPLRTCLVHIAAVAGDEDRCRSLAAAVVRGESLADTTCDTALSLLDLGLGRFADAFERLRRTRSNPAWQNVFYGHLYRVEAAVRTGERDGIADSVASFESWAASSGHPWARSIVLRDRALLAGDDAAERLFRQALALPADGGPPFERARTELLFGEWLRRSRRRSEARVRLRAATELFRRLGAAPWVERAAGELRATGDTGGPVAAPAADVVDRLTPQELQVVRLASTGLSNRDIGARLFLSPRTIGYHLYKAYPKLGVSSRVELSRLRLGGADGDPPR